MEYTKRKVSDEFGKYLKTRRIQRCLTLKDVENKTGISASYVNRLEHGERLAPSIPVLESLSKCLDINCTELIKIALQDKDTVYIEDRDLYKVLCQNSMTICGKRANYEIKECIQRLVCTIIKEDWKEDFEMSGKILKLADDLKKAWIS